MNDHTVFRTPRLARVLIATALLAAGCATPVGVSRIDPEAAYRLHTESALSEGHPSEASKMVLRRTMWEPMCSRSQPI